MRKKMSAADRLARRPGRKIRATSAVILESNQSLNPHIPELNRKNADSSKNRPGAPFGNQNRLRHGLFTRAQQTVELELRILWRQARWLERYALLSRKAFAARL